MFQASPEYVKYLESFKRFGVREFKELPPLRPKLGDNISLLVRQDIEFSIIGLSPKTYVPYIYSWGKFVGNQVAGQALATLKVGLAARMAAKVFTMALLRTAVYQDALARGWIENLAGIPELTYFDERAKVFRMRDAECDEAAGLPDIGKPVCFYEAGAIAGNTELALGRPVNAFETKCIAAGDQACEFVGEIDSPFPRAFKLLETSDFKKIRGALLEKMFKPCQLRARLGNFTHLAQFQVFYLGVVLSSPGAHTMLYWIGRNLGQEIGNRIKERTPSAQLKRLAALLEQLKICKLEFERNGGRFTFTAKESAFSTGAANFHRRICSYLAGLLAGFCAASWGGRTNVIETECIANGDLVCRFETV